MSGSLKNLRALEMGQLIAGPFCGQLMADHGAEVIKIELPGEGDPMRAWGRGKPVWFPIMARNKKCITLNLRTAKGQDILRQLAAKSDFLIENFRPGTLEKWNLSYENLKHANHGLIMVRVSGFGQTGPYAQRAGYGAIGEAMGGMRYLAGDPSTPPSRVGLSIGDSLAATYACLGALMALNHRHASGEGQVVDSAIYESVLAMMESTVPEYTEAGIIRERTGSILPKIAPSNVYDTQDGQIVIGANQDSVWKRMAEAMGRPELGTDPLYATHVARGENQAQLDALINAWTRGFSSPDLLSKLHESGVPAGKIYRAPDMLEDPHFAARQALIKVDHPKYANLWMQNVFPKLSATPGEVRSPGPEVGAHNEEVYGELLGYRRKELETLSEEGII
jgi:crotonobetainyl-CoA:carnitine CoA-transferase CaiB-like acyl-CoA transferase